MNAYVSKLYRLAHQYEGETGEPLVAHTYKFVPSPGRGAHLCLHKYVVAFSGGFEFVGTDGIEEDAALFCFQQVLARNIAVDLTGFGYDGELVFETVEESMRACTILHGAIFTTPPIRVGTTGIMSIDNVEEWLVNDIARALTGFERIDFDREEELPDAYFHHATEVRKMVYGLVEQARAIWYGYDNVEEPDVDQPTNGELQDMAVENGDVEPDEPEHYYSFFWNGDFFAILDEANDQKLVMNGNFDHDDPCNVFAIELAMKHDADLNPKTATEQVVLEMHEGEIQNYELTGRTVWDEYNSALYDNEPDDDVELLGVETLEHIRKSHADFLKNYAISQFERLVDDTVPFFVTVHYVDPSDLLKLLGALQEHYEDFDFDSIVAVDHKLVKIITPENDAIVRLLSTCAENGANDITVERCSTDD